MRWPAGRLEERRTRSCSGLWGAWRMSIRRHGRSSRRLIAGTISAVKSNSPADLGVMLVALFGLSMPNFWLGLLLIQYFAVDLGWFRPSGWGTWSQNILPVITLGTGGAAIIARMTRSSMLEVLSEDYVRTARAKGLSPTRVIGVHALRNALLPVVTVIGLSVSGLMAGAVLTETIFSWPGVGHWLIDSIGRRDYPALQGGVLLISAVVVFVNLVVDLVYGVIDPRIRHAR